jgi:LPXTG-motif cell wall-anchored protein
VLAGRTTVVERKGEPVRLPVGARCWARETVDHAATSTTVDHGTRADATTVTSTSTRSLQRSTIRVVNDFQSAPRVLGLSTDGRGQRGVDGDDDGRDGADGVDGGDGGGDADAAHGGLPDTGSPASPWLLLGGGLAVVLGAGLLVRRRRV